MMKYIYTIFILLIISCQNKKNGNDDRISLNNNDKIIQELKEKSIEKGDEDAYGRLIDYYSNNPSKYYEMLPISIIVADKYNYDNAYASVFYEFIMLYNNGKSDYRLFNNLNDQQKNYVMLYLIKGMDNNSVSSIGILEKLNREGIGIELNIAKADSLQKLNNKLIYGNDLDNNSNN